MNVLTDDTGDENFDPVEAFTQLWNTDADEPSPGADEKPKPVAKPKKPAADDEPTDDDTDVEDDEAKSDPKDQDEDGADDGDEDSESEDGDEKPVVESDDVIVKVKADGKETEVPLGQLKRLFGQEASLTRKSQEVAATRKTLEEQATVTAAALERQLTRAREKFLPYANADWARAAREMEEADFNAARAAAQAAYEDVSFLESELQGFAQDLQKRTREAHGTAAKKCIEVLSDPIDGIEGWGKELYTDLVGFAQSQGLAKEVTNALTDPAAFKLLHMAMLYQRGREKVKTDKDTSAKAKKKAPPKKIVKGSASGEQTRKAASGGSKVDKALGKLQRSGTREDATNAFMALWEADASD